MHACMQVVCGNSVGVGIGVVLIYYKSLHLIDMLAGSMHADLLIRCRSTL